MGQQHPLEYCDALQEDRRLAKGNCNPGDLVHCTGRLRNGKYEKDGETIYTVDAIAERFHRLTEKQMDADDES